MHRIALAVSLTLAATGSRASAQTLHFPQPTPSPRIEALRARLSRGDTATVVAEFWEDMRRATTPIVEPFVPDRSFILVTFVYRDSVHARNILVSNGPAGWEEALMTMTPIGGTNIWYRTVVLPGNARVGYQFRVNDPMIPFWADANFPAAFATWHGDQLNPSEDVTMRRRLARSIVTGPAALAQPWTERHGDVPRGRLDSASIRSTILGQDRSIMVYTPPGFRAAGAGQAAVATAPTPMPVLVMFDGGPFTSDRFVPTPTIIDNLIAAGRIQPLVAVFVANGAARMKELGCDSLFSNFVATEVMPWVQSRYGVTIAPRTTVIGGSSHGGLGATCTAMRFPKTFGNVISQSGSYWWKPAPTGEDEWVTSELAIRPLQPIRFYLEVGIFETDRSPDGGPGQVATNRHLRDVLRARGYDVMYSEFPGAHEYFNWRGTLSTALVHFLPRTR